MATVLIVVPANNTTMEPEMRALYPGAREFLVARVPRPARTLVSDDIPAYGRATVAAVAPFVARRPDLVVYGCTAAGFLAGPDGNARMVADLAAATGAPVVSTANAMVEALAHDGVVETAVVTPYLPAVNDGLVAYLRQSGVEVTALASFLCATTDALGRITAEEVEAKALATVTPSSRALFIACSQLPTLGIVGPLRRRLAIPVWSSIQATAWSGAKALAARGQTITTALAA